MALKATSKENLESTTEISEGVAAETTKYESAPHMRKSRTIGDINVMNSITASLDKPADDEAYDATASQGLDLETEGVTSATDKINGKREINLSESEHTTDTKSSVSLFDVKEPKPQTTTRLSPRKAQVVRDRDANQMSFTSGYVKLGRSTSWLLPRRVLASARSVDESCPSRSSKRLAEVKPSGCLSAIPSQVPTPSPRLLPTHGG